MVSGLATPPTPSIKGASWGQVHGGAFESPTPSSVPSTIIKDHEVDHSASPHLQASKQGEPDM